MKRRAGQLEAASPEGVAILSRVSKAALVDLACDLVSANFGHAGQPVTESEVLEMLNPVLRCRGDREVRPTTAKAAGLGTP